MRIRGRLLSAVLLAGAGTLVVASTASAATTAPSSPRRLVASPRAGAIAVSWLAPLLTGGQPIIRYVITASPGGRTCATAGAQACTVTGLVNGVAYRFTGRAINAARLVSPSSLPSVPVVAGVPTAPDLLGVAFPSPGHAVVRWQAPRYTGACPVTRYAVRWLPSSGAWSTWSSVTALAASRTGLQPGIQTVEVRARNCVGYGPWDRMMFWTH